MKIKRKADSPDGLDAIREAYETLCGVFDAAEVVEVDYENGYVEVLLRLPGSGKMVDPNDAHALNSLEKWLLAQYDKGGEAS